MSWEENVRRITPYTPGEQPAFTDMIKLNTNENPYPPAPSVQEALAAFDFDRLRLYPATDGGELTKALAEYHGVDASQVFVGVGSDDVIALAFLTFFNGKRPVLFPDVSYSFYPVWAELYGIPYRTPALDEDFRLVKEDYLTENGGIIFPNPNAPTGLAVDLSFIEEIVSANPDSVVMIDEAYVDFGTESALALLPKYENLLVIRTFSKSRSLAGLRIGYAIGSEKLIRCLNDVKFSINSYTMNRPSLSLGCASIADEGYFREHIEMIIRSRERLKKELTRLGFSFPDSCANFVFATHKELRAEEILAFLRERHIFVRHFKLPRIDNYLRITVGTDAEIDRLINALEELIKC